MTHKGHISFINLFFFFLAFLQLSLCFFLFLLVFVFSTTFATSFIFLVHLLDGIEITFFVFRVGFFLLVGFEFIAFLIFF
jgi:hypothetical protein